MVEVRCTNLSVSFPGQQEPAFAHIDLDLCSGAILGIVGPSGAGKTSLCFGLAGFYPDVIPAQVRGTIDYADGTGTKLGRAAARSRIGVVTQDPWAQITGMGRTCAEEIAFGLRLRGIYSEEIGKRVSAALTQMGIESLYHREVSSLSGGELQRLIIACFTALNCELLMLDQPFTHLDADGVSRVRDVILRISRQNGSVLVADEATELLSNSCKEFLILNAGKPVFKGSADEVSALALERWGLQTPLMSIAERERAKFKSHGGNVPHQSGIHNTMYSSGNSAIVLQEVAAGYQPGNPVLRDVSFKAGQGEKIAIAGRNGAGKTTLVRVIAGLLAHDNGKVSLFGEELNDRTSTQLRRLIGYSFQNPLDQFFKNSVREEVGIGLRARRYDEKDIKKMVDESLEIVGLSDVADNHPYDLSDAKRRLLGVAIAIASKPRLLIVDEPTANLDFQGKLIVGRIICEVSNSGTTVLAISHDADFTAEHFDRIVLLQAGKITREGTPSEILLTEDARLAGLAIPSAARVYMELAGLTPNSPAMPIPLTRQELLSFFFKGFIASESR